MNIQAAINNYLTSLPEPKQTEMFALHQLIVRIFPDCKLWFLDGKNEKNKIVSNPNIGYGSCLIKYVNGTSKEFYQVGLSGNKTGISIYIFGIKDKEYLAKTFSEKLGKARVSGYCIKFKTKQDINLVVLEIAIRFGFEQRERI